jgi:radical SAM protein with 4Fe4S-binding SPASM domain
MKVNKFQFRWEEVTADSINNTLLPGLRNLEINPTELCNRTCSFCPRVNAELYPNSNLHMKLETAKLLSEQLQAAKYTGEVGFVGFGEPVLAKNILDLLAEFTPYFYTYTMTNGDVFLKGRQKVEDYINIGVQLLIVNCYDNKEHLEKLSHHFKPYGNQIKIQIRHLEDTGEVTIFKEYGLTNRGGIFNKVEPQQRGCYIPFYKAIVDWNGDVLLCSKDWQRQEKNLNNITNKPFPELWTSSRYNHIRKTLLKGNRIEIPACKHCDVNGLRVGKESVEVFKNIL